MIEDLEAAAEGMQHLVNLCADYQRILIEAGLRDDNEVGDRVLLAGQQLVYELQEAAHDWAL